MERIPRHIAIIMDGNGRWAKKQGLARMFGHKQGVTTVHNITEAAAEIGIEYLTLYAFSTENWNRPKEEVDALMALLVDTIAKETPTLMKNNVRLLTIGDINRLPQATREKFLGCIEQTSTNTGLNLVLALSYSSRWEMIEATKRIAAEVQNGTMSIDDINEATISNHLTTKLNYRYFYNRIVNERLITVDDLYEAIIDYQHRERRFGKTSEQLKVES